jgi:hypothetical protein
VRKLTPQRMVAEFHRAFGGQEDDELRWRLPDEEPRIREILEEGVRPGRRQPAPAESSVRQAEVVG